MPTRREVAQFLGDFKAALSLGYVYWVQRSAREKVHLSGLEINRNQAIEYLHGLTPDSYSKGPDPDDFKPEREVWCFGCDILGTEAYIKIAIQPDRKRRSVVHAVIWSFHKAEHPMRYPLRESS